MQQQHSTPQGGKGTKQDAKKRTLREPIAWPFILIAVVCLAAVVGGLYYYHLIAPNQPRNIRIEGTVTKPPPGLPDRWPYNTKEWQAGWDAGLAVGPDGKNKFGQRPLR